MLLPRATGAGAVPATMPNRAQDWVLQAEYDLQHAHRAREVDDHDWACFAAQQADPT